MSKREAAGFRAWTPEYVAMWTEAVRINAMDALGGVCQACGEADQRVLQFDHVVPLGGYAWRRNHGNNRTLLYAILRGEDQGVQLLCANCHLRKTFGDIRTLRTRKATTVTLTERPGAGWAVGILAGGA